MNSEFIEQAEKLARESPQAIVSLYALDETCIWASPSHQEIMGRDPKEMIGLSWRHFVAPEDHAHAILAGDDALLNGRSIDFTIRARSKGGSRVQLKGVAWIMLDQATGEGCLVFTASPS